MDAFIQKYFSIDGRLTRLPYFTRSVEVYIIVTLISTASIPLFLQGGDLLWWAGFVVAAIACTVAVVTTVSLVVRRLHDIGTTGYHAIWIIPLLFIPAWGRDIYLALPLIALSLWLMFWPGRKTTNPLAA